MPPLITLAFVFWGVVEGEIKEVKMEITNLVINILGYLVLGWLIWLLRNQIKLQKDTLDSQSKIIQNMKMFVEIFEPEKIKEFVKMREVTFEDTKNKEIEKIKSEMEKKLEKRTNALEFLSREFESVLDIMFNLIYHVRPDIRTNVIKGLPDSATKKHIMSKINEFPYYGDDYANELRRILSENVSFSEQAKVEIKH